MKIWIFRLLLPAICNVVCISTLYSQSSFYVAHYNLGAMDISISEPREVKIPDITHLSNLQALNKNTWIFQGKENDRKIEQLYSMNIENGTIAKLTEIDGGIRSFYNYNNETFLVPNISPKSIYKIVKDSLIYMMTSPVNIQFFSIDDVNTFVCNSENEMFAINDKQTPKIVSHKTGTPFYPLQNGEYSFVYQFNKEFWYLKRFNPTDMNSKIIIKMPESVKSYSVLGNSVVLTYMNNKIMSYVIDKDIQWHETGIALPESMYINLISSNMHGTLFFQAYNK